MTPTSPLQATMRTYVYGALPPTQGAEHVEQQLRLAHRYRNKLVEIERARREAVAAAGEDAEAKEHAHTGAKEAVRAARAESGVYWGTYLLVEDDVQRSNRSSKEAPHFVRWDGRGRLGVQLQQGLGVPDLLAGNGRLVRVKISENGRRAEVHFRVGSTGREPLWAVFPIVYHRPLPPAAQVKWVRAAIRRVGVHTKWEIHFVLDNVDARLPSPVLGHVAVDVGWRRFQNVGVRVAVWVDDAGRQGELRLPERLVERWQKVADLRSIRDIHFNVQRDALAVARKSASSSWPQWFLETTETLHLWKSPERLRQLVRRWGRNRFAGDEGIFAPATAWFKKEVHLLSWEANQRENVLRARREIYRLFALQLARYKRATIEHLNLRDFAELPGPGEPEDPRTAASRGRRFQASLHELFACIADAAGRSGTELTEMDPAYTTQRCAFCGYTEVFDAAGQVSHVCTGCGRSWDQDINAAMNLLRAPPERLHPCTRSRRQISDIAGESDVQKRRNEGKARVRAKRSQNVAQTIEVIE